jgi:NADH:ubiquinone oxidoreductase subunit 5 (subunit L)/multisubunit Na+/H+ antiporter MnhA subunit
MGGLNNLLPCTYSEMFIGYLVLAGIPFCQVFIQNIYFWSEKCSERGGCNQG